MPETMKDSDRAKQTKTERDRHEQAERQRQPTLCGRRERREIKNSEQKDNTRKKTEVEQSAQAAQLIVFVRQIRTYLSGMQSSLDSFVVSAERTAREPKKRRSSCAQKLLQFIQFINKTWFNEPVVVGVSIVTTSLSLYFDFRALCSPRS